MTTRRSSDKLPTEAGPSSPRLKQYAQTGWPSFGIRPTRRVLLIDLGGSFGGVESYLAGLASLLSESAEIYALCVLPKLAERLSAQGVKVVRLPLFAGPLKPLRFLAALAVLPWLLVRHRIDCIQLNGFLESIFVFPARLLGRRAIYTRHGPFELEQYRWWREPHKVLPRAVAKWNTRFASHVVCVSDAVKASVQPLLPPSRYSVISNWIGSHPPPRPVRGELTPRARILCVSRLEPYKGVHLLLEALSGMDDEAELVVAGDGSYREELERMALDRTNIRFLGFQNDMRRLYAEADIFVMPSMGPEGLPMVSLEAMSYGLPCIFSDLAVHREITDDGRGACLFRSGDAESLRAALRNLLEDKSLRQRFSAEALRIVAARYTETSARSAYLQIFSERTLHA